jgi:hypothetical protein
MNILETLDKFYRINEESFPNESDLAQRKTMGIWAMLNKTDTKESDKIERGRCPDAKATPGEIHAGV